MTRNQSITGIVLVLAGYACNPAKEMKTAGTIERVKPSLDSLISEDARVEIIAEGFKWSEGPVWVESEKMLLFSDIPNNTIFKWTEEKGKEIYLNPSGYTGTTPRGGETGSNGLLLDDKGNLVLCQHGDRRLARMSAPLNAPKPVFETLADKYNGKRFNSPNDAVFRGGEYFFTDPAYGLEKQMDDPAKEIPFQGVYHLRKDGTVNLLTDTLTRPNGLIFSLDGRSLLVANSDPQKAVWYQFTIGTDLGGTMTLLEGRIFYDASDLAGKEKGLPDGMKSDSKGNIFATGPGGVFIFDQYGNLKGKIKLDEPSSNCALSADEKTLYITNNMYLVRVKMRE